MYKLYKPVRIYIVIDILLLILGFYIVLDWFPLATKTPFQKYSLPSLLYLVSWIFVSYLLRRYKPLKQQKYGSALLKMFYTVLFVFLLYWALLHFFFKPYSGFVLLTISIGALIVNYAYWSLMFAYKSAIAYNDFVYEEVEEREHAAVIPTPDLDDESYQEVSRIIHKHSGGDVFGFLASNLALQSGNTRVYTHIDSENLKMNTRYRYSAIVQLERLNNMRSVNETFCILNEKLPDNGVFVCCFESKSTRKQRLLKKYPFGLNYLLYFLDFIHKRIMPKILILSAIYYFVTKGKNRILSKTEVLGRLYCTGFIVVKEKKIGKLTWFIVKRVKQPESRQKRVYGPLISLRRYGKGGKFFDVYKMRTMHPYAEYIQAYIYERNSLQDGGKFKRDIRVTTLGGFMRKYWLDELPMLINLLKREMKIVGVRPLSSHYFSLYDKELQEKRIRFKPGLLPPFYADMPKTLDEIQASEMRYLEMCETRGIFMTDILYFFRILNNIFFRKARSA